MHVFGYILVDFQKQISFINDYKMRIYGIAFVMNDLGHDVGEHLRSGDEDVSFGPIYTFRNVSFNTVCDFLFIVRRFLFFVLSKNIKEMYQEIDNRSKMANRAHSENIKLVLRVQQSDFSVNLETELFVESEDNGPVFMVFFEFEALF